MTPISRRSALLAGTALLAAPVIRAQGAYPNHPVQLIHGFGAGGNADVVSRLIGKKLQDYLGQPVVVEIKSGAGGTIATNFVAKAPADGYTLIMLTGGHTASAALRKSLPYDPVDDFAFLSTVSSFPFVVAVRPDHPAKNLAELLAMARKDPGKITFSSVGIGSTQHMVGELLASTAKVQLLHIPYRGGGAPVQAVVAGDVDLLIDTPTVAVQQVLAGRLRGLAVTSASEWPALPGVPPVATVLPGFAVGSWLGLAAPAGTPADIVQKLTAEIHRALKDSELQQALASAGSAPAPCTPQEMRSMVASDITRWRAVVQQAGIPLQG